MGLEERLRAVVDPLLGQPLGEIDALRSVERDGTRARLTVQLPAPGERLRHETLGRLLEAARGEGVEQLEVSWLTKMPSRPIGPDDPVPSVRNLLLVMAGKGGVGKSTVACNLAVAFAAMGLRTGLLDADVYGPSIPTMMGIEGPLSADEQRKIRPHERLGIALMSLGFMLENPTQAVIWRGPMLSSALRQMLGDVGWGDRDVLVIDAPPGTGDVAITLSQSAKGASVLLVTTPQEVALSDVYKCVTMCRKLELPIVGVVENMSWFVDSAGVRHTPFGQGGGARIAEMAGAPLLGQIPLEPAVCEQGDAGDPIVHARPDSAAARAFVELAERVAEQLARLQFERGGVRAITGSAPRRLRIVR
ncbi:MAG: Mrp/NBP35 family ATP-binding protein [Myxococcota bacterium]|nr:Mrp/NBP35 family ATP-binding protein [Myxococcota bacterium]MDW8361895.1 Mrp/NBP35 family ATP-binding protein [Myxococcales bacterium]